MSTFYGFCQNYALVKCQQHIAYISDIVTSQNLVDSTSHFSDSYELEFQH